MKFRRSERKGASSGDGEGGAATRSGPRAVDIMALGRFDTRIEVSPSKEALAQTPQRLEAPQVPGALIIQPLGEV